MQDCCNINVDHKGRIHCPVPSVSLTSALNIQHKAPWNPPSLRGREGLAGIQTELKFLILPLWLTLDQQFFHTALSCTHTFFWPPTALFLSIIFLQLMSYSSLLLQLCVFTECSVELYSQTFLLSEIILSPADPAQGLLLSLLKDQRLDGTVRHCP